MKVKRICFISLLRDKYMTTVNVNKTCILKSFKEIRTIFPPVFQTSIIHWVCLHSLGRDISVELIKYRIQCSLQIILVCSIGNFLVCIFIFPGKRLMGFKSSVFSLLVKNNIAKLLCTELITMYIQQDCWKHHH